MRLIDADEAKKQIKQMQVLKPSEKTLLMLALDRTPTYEPPNDPLTLEKLREMDGEPVWLTRAGYQSRWALVFVFSKRENIIRLTFDNGSQPIAKTLLDGCKIYRRKPEEGAP